ncbi:uncharacterized protein GIQ15_00850 [Arthroderma uncinatum]|uniref:uncharacterized protein n=1 Tax=Arthroderma uncinatum TaxID=74035 RepID=UPI00144ACC4C|nr:uncharacterized protein GIQ15_00850 [Arthroderma uncinatum]KAF3491333.1 hypothetical protein GIQ15_00850 [Arthroderma uncinatum]
MKSRLADIEPYPSDTDSPPAYEAAVTGAGTQVAPPKAQQSSGAVTLTINGKYIYSSASPGEQPVYSLTHALDGHEISQYGVLLTRIEQRTVSSASQSGPTTKTVKRDVFALRDAPLLHIGHARYEIDGRRYFSDKRGQMSRSSYGIRSGWAAWGKGLPSFVLERSESGNASTAGETTGSSFYEWREKENGPLIAMETRRRWDMDSKTEISPPKLDLIKSWNDFDREYLDFMVAAWCMHNWREAKEVTKEPITWDERESYQYLPLQWGYRYLECV